MWITRKKKDNKISLRVFHGFTAMDGMMIKVECFVIGWTGFGVRKHSIPETKARHC